MKLELDHIYHMDCLEGMKQNVFSVDGEMRTRNTTKVTGKGQIYFINKFVGQLQTAE